MSSSPPYEFYVMTASGDDFAASELESLGFANLVSCCKAGLFNKIKLKSVYVDFKYELYQYWTIQESEAFRSGFSYYTDNLDHDQSKTRLIDIVEMHQLISDISKLEEWLLNNADKFEEGAINWNKFQVN